MRIRFRKNKLIKKNNIQIDKADKTCAKFSLLSVACFFCLLLLTEQYCSIFPTTPLLEKHHLCILGDKLLYKDFATYRLITVTKRL